MSGMTSLWELEEEVRRKLKNGVDFGGRFLAVAGLDAANCVKWVKLQGSLLEVIYILPCYRLTVHAAVGSGVEIMSAALDGTCGGAHD